MTYVIDRGVPLPPSHSIGAKYPFASMQVGDSFLVPMGPDKNFPTERRAASMYAARNNIKLVCRKVKDGLRVWRTA